MSLSINTTSVSAIGIDLSPIPSVGLCVCRSARKYTVAKRLTGSGCRWDGEWGQWKDGDGVVIIEGERAVLEVNFGRAIVTMKTLLQLCGSA